MIPMRPVAEAACKAVSFSWRDERGRNRKCGASTATVTSETKALGNRHGMAENQLQVQVRYRKEVASGCNGGEWGMPEHSTQGSGHNSSPRMSDSETWTRN